MKFKMVIAFLPEERLDEVLEAARKAGATGSTVITSARGEGLEPERRFLGLEVASHRNLVFWLVEESVAPGLMQEIAAVGRFEAERGAGIACQIDIEAAVGQIEAIEGNERDPSDPTR